MMGTPYQPAVGDWFQDISGQSFEVVAYDEEDGTVEIQYFDGTVEEWDTDTWAEMGVKPTEPPEDWSGSYDIQREDYYGVDIPEHRHEDWVSELDDLDL
jgi:hypothetical protein